MRFRFTWHNRYNRYTAKGVPIKGPGLSGGISDKPGEQTVPTEPARAEWYQGLYLIQGFLARGRLTPPFLPFKASLAYLLVEGWEPSRGVWEGAKRHQIASEGA